MALYNLKVFPCFSNLRRELTFLMIITGILPFFYIADYRTPCKQLHIGLYFSYLISLMSGVVIIATFSETENGLNPRVTLP